MHSIKIDKISLLDLLEFIRFLSYDGKTDYGEKSKSNNSIQQKTKSNFERDLQGHCLWILEKQDYLPRVRYVIAVKLFAIGTERTQMAAENMIRGFAGRGNNLNDLFKEIALASINIDVTIQFLNTIQSLKIYSCPYSDFLQPLNSKFIRLIADRPICGSAFSYENIKSYPSKLKLSGNPTLQPWSGTYTVCKIKHDLNCL